MPSLYQTLELKNNEHNDENAIKRKYRKLAIQHHPDKAGKQAEEQFKEIIAAYKVLLDTQRREQYKCWYESDQRTESNSTFEEVAAFDAWRTGRVVHTHNSSRRTAHCFIRYS